MKRKPDMMITLVILFCVGIIISGFTTFNYVPSRPVPLLSSVSADIADPDYRRE